MKHLAVAVVVTLSLASLGTADTITQFRTELSPDYVILGGVQGTMSMAGGYAEFTLTEVDGDPTQNTVAYFIQFENVDLDGGQTPDDPFDDITALHIHDTTRCVVPQCVDGDTAGTVHLLNIFGAPRLDDDDIVVDPVAGTISGLWDEDDASPPDTPVPSLAPSDPLVLDVLFNEQAALFVHTQEVPTAAAGGPMLIVPEPSSLALLLGLLGVMGLRRRVGTSHNNSAVYIHGLSS